MPPCSGGSRHRRNHCSVSWTQPTLLRRGHTSHNYQQTICCILNPGTKQLTSARLGLIQTCAPQQDSKLAAPADCEMNLPADDKVGSWCVCVVPSLPQRQAASQHDQASRTIVAGRTISLASSSYVSGSSVWAMDACAADAIRLSAARHRHWAGGGTLKLSCTVNPM